MKNRTKKKLTKKIINSWKKDVLKELPKAGTLISKIYWTKKGVKLCEIPPFAFFVEPV